MASASETQVVGAKGGLDRWYYFSQSMECELCAMMKAQMSWKYGPRGLAICAISFNGSPRRLKGWINSWLAFSFSVNVGDIERVDHDTRTHPGRDPTLGSNAPRKIHGDNLVFPHAGVTRRLLDKRTATGYLQDEDMKRVDLARTWIQDCHRAHAGCNFPGTSYSPSRLVDVKNCKLIDTQQCSGPFQYTALTHCWGPNMPESGMTKTRTLGSHLRRIQFSELPRSFRDAILISKSLDIPYIWIDSLCILQDSREDWETVSAEMGLVYSHAWCTIAASSAKCCHDGIDLVREKRTSCEVMLYGDQDKRVGVSITEDPPTWQAFYASNPLNKRGWTFQERELSPRILHFSTDQIWWECRSMRAQEGPDLFDDNIGEPAISVRKKTTELRTLTSIIRAEEDYARIRLTKAPAEQSRIEYDPKIFPGLEISQAFQLRCLDNMLVTSKSVTAPAMLKNLFATEARYNTWLKAVQDYSTRAFTVITDRLPALSGFVSEMQARHGGEYVAGVWREDLLRSLLWRRDSRTTTVASTHTLPRRPSEYRAPSWSWAAVDNAISYDLVIVNRLQIDRLRPTTAHIENVSVVPAGLDPRGRLKGGSLLISGKLKVYTPSSMSRSMIFHFDFRDEADDLPVYLLSLFESSSMDRITGRGTLAWALALVMVEDPVPVFRRVGVVSKALSEWFIDAMDVKIPII